MNKEAIIVTERIGIGMSACCMGCPVRYNNKGWDLTKNLGREKGDFRWYPVCPECMAGLSVPREPIHITGGDGFAVWNAEAQVKNKRGQNMTQLIKEGCLEALEVLKRGGVEAYVYMDGSPSCGVYRTTLKNTRTGNPPGVFGALLLNSGYFLIPASDLQSPLKWWDRRRRLMAFTWLKKTPIVSKSELFDVWNTLKFLCQELDDTWARKRGREIAVLSKELELTYIEQFKTETLELLRRPSTTVKITNSLWKNYVHYKKASGDIIPEIMSPENKRNITTIASELIKIERSSFENNKTFGTSPIIYREKRRAHVEQLEDFEERINKLESDL